MAEIAISPGELSQRNLYALGAGITGDPSEHHEVRLLLDPNESPDGLQMSETGDLSWRPTLDQVGRHKITVIAVAADDPTCADAEDFFINVTVNQPPALDAIPDQTATVVDPLELVVSATDPNAGDQLTFQLDPDDAPAGATIEQLSGDQARIRWQPSTEDVGQRYTFRVIVVDDGDPALADSSEFQVRVENVAPTITMPPATLQYVENDGAVAVAEAVALEDVDDTVFVGASVSIVSGFVAGEDALRATAANPNIRSNYDSDSGTLTFTGEASIAAYETLLRGVAYENTSEDPSGELRTIRFRICDVESTAEATRLVSVVPVNDSPQIRAIPDQSVFVGDELVVPIIVDDPDDSEISIFLDRDDSPSGASVTMTGPSTATLHWLPGFEHVSTPTSVRLLAADGGDPALLDSETFAIRVGVDSNISDLAFQLLSENASFHQDHFFVYQDADSGFNHGFPSGFFAIDFLTGRERQRDDLIQAITVDMACVDDASSPNGCSSSSRAMDRERGNVARITLPPLPNPTEVAGVIFVEPESFAVSRTGVGYDLSDTTHIVFEARSPEPGMTVQITVGGSNTLPIEFRDEWREYSVDLASLRDPDTGRIKPPNLANVQDLFGVVATNQYAPTGGSILLNDVRFVRLQDGQELPPGNPLRGQRYAFPLSNITVGVVPGRIDVIDNTGDAFSTSGAWATKNNANAYLGAQAVSFGGGEATFAFSGLAPREYVAEATWGPITQSGPATFSLFDGDVLRSELAFDQSAPASGSEFDDQHWTSLGAVRVESGELRIIIAGGDADTIAADAVRLVPVFPPDQAIRNMTTIYESSLVLFSMLQRGTSRDLEQAELIADTILYAMANDPNPNGTALPTAPGGERGLRDSYSSGDLAWFNSQGDGGAQRGDARLVGFSSDPRLCDTGFCLVLDGAFGGNVAFGVMALMHTYSELDDVKYLDGARELGHWIYENLADRNGPAFGVPAEQVTYGGYFLGYPDQGVVKDRVESLVRGKSIENNADQFAAFQMLAAAELELGNEDVAATWSQYAAIAGDFVIAMYDPGDPTNPRDGRFYTGTLPDGPNGPPTGPGLEPGPRRGSEFANTALLLDNNTFTTLALAASPEYRNAVDRNGDRIDWKEPVRFTLDTFRQQITARSVVSEIPIPYAGFNIVPEATPSPFRPGGPIGGLPQGIAWEFTGQVVTTMKFLDELYATDEFDPLIDYYLDQLRLAQLAAPFGDGRGLAASTLDGESEDMFGYEPLYACLGTPFQCIAERVGLAATTWAIFADQGWNVFRID